MVIGVNYCSTTQARLQTDDHATLREPRFGIVEAYTTPLYQVIKEYVRFFNQARPHQGIEQKISERIRSERKENPKGKIIAFPVFNGLHRDHRHAA
jgi:hypothetical protein